MMFSRHTSHMRTKAALAAVALACSLHTRAEGLWAYDGFDHSLEQTLQGKGGGSGWAGNWSLNGTMAFVGGLGYEDTNGQRLLVSGNAVESRGASVVAERFTVTDFGAPGTTVWMSVLQRNLDNIVPVHQAGITLGVNENAPTMIGGLVRGDTGSVRTGIRASNNGTASSFAIADGSIALLQAMFHVIRIDFAATGQNDTMSIWRNPLLGVDPGVPDAKASFVNSDSFMTGAALLASGETATSHFVFDELRIGSSFAAVTPAVPEPATGALGLLGGATIAVALRRRTRTAGAATAPGQR